MAIFSCGNCGLAITVADEELGNEVVCTGCNTRQRVPPEAVLKEAMPVAPVPSKAAYVPEYGLAMTIAIALWCAGIAILVAGVGWLLSPTPVVGLSLLVGGTMTIAIGQILSFARQVARQTYVRALDR